jgi:O-antigen ligase
VISPVNTADGGLTLPIVQRRVTPSSRLLCWEAAAKTFAQHPVLGQGTGTDIPCPAYRDASGDVQHLLSAHNMYLSVAAQKGVAGLLALMALFIFVLRRGGWTMEGASGVVQAGLTIAFVQAVLYQGLGLPMETVRVTWIVIGLCCAAGELRHGETFRPARA